MIPGPYLVYLGAVTDPLAAKTARGIAFWRPAWRLPKWPSRAVRSRSGCPG
jgi:hypothetical protein